MSDNIKDRHRNDSPQTLPPTDGRQVRVLSPSALVAMRFFRNRLAVMGLAMLTAVFLFSYLGSFLSPYGQDEQFFTYTELVKDYAGVVQNKDFRYLVAPGQEFSPIVQAKFILAQKQREESFDYKETTYQISEEGADLYAISSSGVLLAVASKDIVQASDGNDDIPFAVKYEALKAFTGGKESFTVSDQLYTLSPDGIILDEDKSLGFISRLIVKPAEDGAAISDEFRAELELAFEKGLTGFTSAGGDGAAYKYAVAYQPETDSWTVTQTQSTYVYDRYSPPSTSHWLGTDNSGMDVLTRLMYGGRVSLVIGFIVVFISAILGVAVGGVSGYLGGWMDQLLMRLVDILCCIPVLPLIIILGAAMNALRIDPQLRMLYLTLVLGFLGWPSIARLVRGQILSLREQEFMLAAEACGISAFHRIFRHLIPNVIPQLIVVCTMNLGSTILMEATLSFLGLGVKFPFASWGNIMNDVNNIYVLTNYWFVWIPAGICLLVTVLGFNFTGDGLRDAFDPRMKR